MKSEQRAEIEAIANTRRDVWLAPPIFPANIARHRNLCSQARPAWKNIGCQFDSVLVPVPFDLLVPYHIADTL